MALRSIALLFIGLLLSACGAINVKPGMTREEAVAAAGQPTRVVALPDGTRLQYSGQPSLQQAIMVDLDSQGRVRSIDSVLNAAHFQRIVPDQWTRERVELEFGPPARIDHTALWAGDILTYRWYDVENLLYWIYIDAQGTVRRTEQGIELLRDQDID